MYEGELREQLSLCINKPPVEKLSTGGVFLKNHRYSGLIIAGVCAGAINGLLGAGGGMALVPLLGLLTNLEEHEIFTASIAIILPICIVSLTATAISGTVPWSDSLPYLAGSAAGGYLAGRFGQKIPTIWLHRMLGILILWGGFRYLC